MQRESRERVMQIATDREPTVTRATLVTEELRFGELRDAWNRLAAQTDPDCVFLRHEWFDAAWQWVKHDAELAIIAIEEGTTLIGVCPLVRRVRKRNGIALRVLEFLTVPDAQLCTVLACARDHDRAMRSVAAQLAHATPAWDLLELSNLSGRHQAIASLAESLNRAGLSTTVTQLGVNPFVDLTQPWDDYYRARSRHLKKNNNLVANRLARAGSVQTCWTRGPLDAITADASVSAVVQLSAASWKNSTGFTLNHAGPQRFIRRLTQLAASQGWLSLWLLKLNDTPIAMEYQLIFNGHVHALRSDFDDAQRHLSPGSLLNWRLLEQLFSSDLRAYHMGLGDNAYKMRWSDRGEALHRITAYNKTVAGFAMQAMDRTVRPLVRKFKDAARGSQSPHDV